jgi:hypothetical protein
MVCCSKQWEEMFEIDAAAYKIRAREVWAPRRRSWTAQRVCKRLIGIGYEREVPFSQSNGSCCALLLFYFHFARPAQNQLHKDYVEEQRLDVVWVGGLCPIIF